ncbi:hypothetical protein FN846DRAFT_911182 [Sphaerosporella brunnea]|uniref:Uncharacterized protein n=1 Tax=Sphaerosporella brunnea TaxID=1250544 RepID=A0A5J5ELD0_9PEZI|nr:hypothetical protein FN846DRAFT_911182 [Sphaerosporella brunnea]
MSAPQKISRIGERRSHRLRHTAPDLDSTGDASGCTGGPAFEDTPPLPASAPSHAGPQYRLRPRDPKPLLLSADPPRPAHFLPKAKTQPQRAARSLNPEPTPAAPALPRGQSAPAPEPAAAHPAAARRNPRRLATSSGYDPCRVESAVQQLKRLEERARVEGEMKDKGTQTRMVTLRLTGRSES